MSKIKNVLRAILKAMAEGRFLHWVVQRIDKIGAWISRYLICRFTKVQKNTIVFMTYGNNYFCNPKYIAEEILRQKLPWRLVWVTAPKKGKAKRGDVPMEIEVVKRNSFEAIRATAQAKVWVDNAINFYWDRNPHKKKEPGVPADLARLHGHQADGRGQCAEPPLGPYREKDGQKYRLLHLQQ